MSSSRTIDLVREIENLERIEVHVRTNQGTYGDNEAGRKVGCADPAFANREEYETVGGVCRSTGPSEERAPGRMRSINRQMLATLRKQLAALRAELRGS